MSAVFLKLLNLSITASWLILAVILVRFLLKKAPKWISCVLWALVAVRLVCPVSLESNLSLIPDIIGNGSIVEQWTDQWIGDPYYIYKGDYVWDAPHEGDTVSDFGWISTDNAPSYTDDGDGYWEYTPQKTVGSTVVPILSYIWLAGVVALLLYALISYIKLKKTVGASVSVRDNILACDEVKSPFILGIIKPLIYVPSSMKGETLDYVITHESAHIQRHDHWWKPLGYFLLTVYWFNPMIWLAYILLCRDIEMACDEKVIRDMDKDSVAAYSQALLDCSFPRRRIAACPLAFGEVGVKERVKSVLNYKKPAFWIIAVAVVACIVVAVCFLTNPRTADISLGNIHISWAKTLDLRPNDPVSRDLSTAQLDELKSRLISLKIGKEEPDFAGLTPFYSISAYSSQTGQFLLAGYNYDGKNNALMYKGKYYRINDADFSAYLSNICAGNDVTEAVMVGNAVKWFDSLHGDEMVWDGMREINLDEFPGITFRAYSKRIEAVTDNETFILYTGMPIWSVYFCDLNGDGKSEVCSTVSFGSEIIENRIIVADYANKAVHELSDRGHYDNSLTFRDGQLWAEKRAHAQEAVLVSGPLVLRSVIGTDGTAIPMLMFGQSELQNKINADIVQGMEVGDIIYVGDIAIQKAPDDDDGPSGPVTGSTTEGFEVKSFGGNTSVDKVLNLDSTYRYFYIYIKNTGGNTISVTIGNNSSTQSNNFHEIPTGNYYIWSTNQWAAQSHDVSFSSINGMYGSAKALLSVLPFDGSTATVDALREKYPEYFDLPTGKGLEVYVWQMAQNSYSFGVLSGTNRYKSPEELWNLKGVSAEEMKAILSTYDIDEQNIYIYPWQNPISSYIAEYWIAQEGEEQSSIDARRQAYLDNIRSMLFD